MRRALRILKIVRVFARYRLDTFLTLLPLPGYVRLLLALMPWRYLIPARRSRAERLRLALEALGPVYIKFGQMLSTRRDLLADDVAFELTKLQDKVPPFAPEQARSIIEQELGGCVTELFARFDAQALASASVAQVHSAALLTGEEVIIKVIRPGIEHTIRRDVDLLYTIAYLLQSVWSEGRRLRPVEVVEEYEQTIIDELDLRKEAANGSQLKRNFADSDILYIPNVNWEMTRQRVLVMERIYGIPVADIEQLHAQGTDMKLLAERGVEIFFTQVFRDSFFHADMHPGNIFVSRENPADPRYIAVDFGIIGSLNAQDQSYLARNLLAFFKQDYRQVAQLHVDSGWVPADTNVHAFEMAIRSVCEPIFEKPLKEISFGQVLLGLFQTARRFNMEVQPQLVLLQKTLLNIEGLGRQLYPDLDLWKTAKPFLEDWMRDRMGPRAVFNSVRMQIPEWLEKLPHIPQLAHDTLVAVKQQSEEHEALLAARDERLARQQLRRRRARLAAIVLLLAGVWYSDTALAEQLQSLEWQSLGLFVLAAWLLARD